MPTRKVKRDPRFSDEDTTLKIIHAIDHNGATSQRTLAKEVEIALGLTNAYLKRCIRKGWVKVTEAPTQRYFYYLTPKGFSEKARLTASYLSNSFEMFRSSKKQFFKYFNHFHIWYISSINTHIAVVNKSIIINIIIIIDFNILPHISFIFNNTNSHNLIGVIIHF